MTFTRIFYYGTVQMDMSADDFWLMILGLFMDLWECHKQYVGIANPKVERFIDDILLDRIQYICIVFVYTKKYNINRQCE